MTHEHLSTGELFDVWREGDIVIKRSRVHDRLNPVDQRWMRDEAIAGLDIGSRVLKTITIAYQSRNDPIGDHIQHFVAYEHHALHTRYVKGQTLRTFINCSDSDLFEIVRQVCETLLSLQTEFPGFRHCDLHLGNVLIDSSRDPIHVTIIDFDGAGQVEAEGNVLPSVLSEYSSVATDILRLCKCIVNELTLVLEKNKEHLWISHFYDIIKSHQSIDSMKTILSILDQVKPT